VRNDAAARRLDLVFVAPGMDDGDVQVTLDGQPVASRFEASPEESLPPSWRAPESTPSLGPTQPLRYEARSSGTLHFALQLPPDRHTINVRYAAQASAYSGDAPTRYWQLGYVLAPARDWASFGALDVAVSVPAGWLAAANLPLERRGDVLSGQFDGIPSDTLAVTTRLPAGAAADPLLVFVLAALLVVGISVWTGRWLAQRRWSLWLSVPFALVLATCWTLWQFAFAAAGSNVPEHQVAWTEAYGRVTLALLLSPIVWVFGLFLSLVATSVAARRARRRVSAHGR
jgi:hypothetical protein